MNHVIILSPEDLNILRNYAEKILDDLVENSPHSHQHALDYALKLKNFLEGDTL